MNKAELSLYIPKYDDLDFRQKLLSDPDTMSYNAKWFPPDGCLVIKKKKWQNWYDTWVNNEPDYFYAYLLDEDNNEFVGEVNYSYDSDNNWWDIGVVILGSKRGKGFGKQGLELLIDYAFNKGGVTCLHNTFETNRDAAYNIHLQCGFKEIDVIDDYVNLLLTKEAYDAVIWNIKNI